MPDNISIRSFQSKDTDSSSTNTPPPRYRSFESASSFFSKTTTIADNGTDDPKGPLGLNLLYSPSKALVDLIFVHGLGGGSRKTWSKTSSISHYWPQQWLPKDPAFDCMRIHSFGYNSDYTKGKDNCLNIHHFGKSLLGEISTSPYLSVGKTPILLMGHSMGGLVIKKTYMLARQDVTYDALAKRIQTVYFLATPHRGSDSAKMLDSILQATYSSRTYVSELTRNSSAIQAINDEFRNYSADLDLWSFYETNKLSMGGLFSKLIVTPDSAILGYREEKQMPMNADHRSICKFDSITDPNYLIIRNALASSINNLSTKVIKTKEKLWRSQARILEKYLGVSGNLEDDLATAEDFRMAGTCEWFSTKDTYLEWREPTSDVSNMFWITGKPAAGKSVLAGYVVDQFKNTNSDCSYFFFKHGDKSKSRLSTCLRYLAFQMACSNSQIRETLLEMHEDIKLDNDNERTLWRKLSPVLLQKAFPVHYWIIDALDECDDFSTLFDLVLPNIDGKIPIRILITSRETADLENGFMSLGKSRFLNERISSTDTLPDIKLLIESKTKTLFVTDLDDHAALVSKLVEKSKGSFLWTVLVLNELSHSYSAAEMNQVLQEVPRGMENMYQRTLDLMSKATRGKKLICAILAWSSCATRPLTTKELHGALKLDVKDNFPNLEETIVALCGQLVSIDKFGNVQMVHETAREFLFREDLESEFAIKKMEAHTRIARTCLLYLTGEEMKPPRSTRRTLVAITTRKRDEFSQYACAAFSYHLVRADPLDDEILVLLASFLKSNILSWIEVISQAQNLVALIRTARDLRKYLKLSSIERSPLGVEMQTIRGWTTDLIRIAAKFAEALIISPSAIYSLILPFCPTDSTVAKTTIPGRKLSVVGAVYTQWDDRLACIDFGQAQTSAVSHGDDYFAIGLTTGTIAMYHATSCQEYRVLDHGEAVKMLQFNHKSNFMASCGLKTIRVWDITSGKMVHNFRTKHRSVCLAFENNILLAASYKNNLVSWNLDLNGSQQADRQWNEWGDDFETPLRRPPSAISISIGHQMMAVAYSGYPVTLWDLKDNAYFGSCGKKLASGETSKHVISALVLNPNENIGLLAVSYLDGDLVLLDPFSDEEVANIRADCHVLVSSPDGRLLAGGAGFGTVQVYEFDTLRLLYRVRSSNFFIKQLAFSRDNLHLADVRGSQGNIWEPAVLFRDLVGDDSHASESTSTTVVEAVVPDMSTQGKISAMILHPTEDSVYCGKEGGAVDLCSAKTGALLQTLYRHKSAVRILSWWSSSILVSVDGSNTIIVWNLTEKKILFQSRLDCGRSITQILTSEAAGKMVLSTRESDHPWRISGEQEDSQNGKHEGVRKWIQHPTVPLQVICVDAFTVKVYSWADWSELASIPLSIENIAFQPKNIISFLSGRYPRLLLELSEIDGATNKRGLLVLDGISFHILENIQLSSLANCVTHIISFNEKGKLIFLDKNSWVCSVDIEGQGNQSPTSYIRHFFVPYDWFSGIREVICGVKKRDVIFARNNNIAIIKGGLEYIEKCIIDTK